MTLNYLNISELLDKAEIDFSVSFVHGLLSAYASGDLHDNRWVTVLQTDLSNVTEQQKGTFQKLADIKQEIVKQLADSEFPFEVMINEQGDIRDQSLSTREWASGFWLGLKHSDILKKITDETSHDFLKDLQRIAAMPLLEEADQESIDDLIQVQEYCRMGAVSLFLSLTNKHENVAE
ncbi:MAG: UPF0149 family protein [Gammaproteobacteria bacterium]|nr:UPF0149 family protein [Gammaproteobacteria bacterium]